ncbi:hypothetical protein CJD36_009155 [Flavipsychrobacter stenotrophus]|uniref:Uncharacterized protein n=1 Tax=Flavipsychrobacter stenotrophus TaxID=2077091 RepID=A0A2S7SYE7_9BACT|nr:hypothetical protein CJD36_009155 [Flavipsychrobacter stenotrophus]
MEMDYVLVPWPDAQLLMEYVWFERECYPMQGMGDQEQYDSAYFVPKHRLETLERELEFMGQLSHVIQRSKK